MLFLSIFWLTNVLNYILNTTDKLRVADVTPGIEVYDDVTSMISAYVPDVSTAAHREGI